jgi:hypothetical protein
MLQFAVVDSPGKPCDLFVAHAWQSPQIDQLSSPDLHPVQNKQHHQREHRPKDAVNERLQMVQENIAVAPSANFVCCERKVLLCPIQFSDQRFNLLLNFFSFLNRQIDPPKLDSGQRNCSFEL